MRNGTRITPLIQSKFILFLLGGLGAFSFAPYFIFPIIWMGLGVLFYILNKATSHKFSFVRAFWFGAGLGAVSMHWLTNALLIDGARFAMFIPAVWIGMGLLFGLFFAVPAWLASYAPSGWKRWSAFAGLFTLFEWGRSWFLTGFPWNPIGNIWNDMLPILQTTSVVGIYGLTLITILCFTLVGFWPRKKPFFYGALTLIVLYALGAWRLYDATTETVFGVQLRLVQPNISQTLKWDPKASADNQATLVRLSKNDNQSITHVIWPESALPWLINYHDSERINLMGTMRQGGTLIMGGLRLVNPEQRTLANSLFVLDDLTDIRAWYDKSHLVPFGEYVPLRGILPLNKIVPFESDFIPGNGLKTLHVPKAPPMAPLVCYEIIFSGRVVDSKHRPAWMVNVTNDGWYGISSGPYQHLAISQTRAIEEGLPLIRVANTGISAVIDSYGHIVQQLPLGTQGIIDSPLPTALPPTIYATYGVHLPIGISILFIIIGFIRRKKP